jgi:hypothetical protein
MKQFLYLNAENAFIHTLSSYSHIKIELILLHEMASSTSALYRSTNFLDFVHFPTMEKNHILWTNGYIVIIIYLKCVISITIFILDISYSKTQSFRPKHLQCFTDKV